MHHQDAICLEIGGLTMRMMRMRRWLEKADANVILPADYWSSLPMDVVVVGVINIDSPLHYLMKEITI